MTRTVRVGALRTELTILSQEEWVKKFPFPEFDLVFVPIFPKTPDELIDLISTRRLDYIHLRPMTLVDKALEMNLVPFAMPNADGHLVRLTGTHLDQEDFIPELDKNT